MNPQNNIINRDNFVRRHRALYDAGIFARGIQYEHQTLDSYLAVIRLADVEKEVAILDSALSSYTVNYSNIANRKYILIVKAMVDTEINIPRNTVFNNCAAKRTLPCKAGETWVLTFIASKEHETLVTLETSINLMEWDDVKERLCEVQNRNVFTDGEKRNVATIPDLTGRVQTLEDCINVEALQENVANLNGTVDVLQGKVQELRDCTDVAAIKDELVEANTALGAHSGRLGALELNRDTLTAAVNILETLTDDHSNRVSNLETSTEDHASRVYDIETQSKAREERVEELETDRDGMKIDIENISALVTQHKETLEAWAPPVDTISGLNARVSTHQADLYGGIRPDGGIGVNIRGTLADWDTRYFAEGGLIPSWEHMIFGTGDNTSWLSLAGRIGLLESEGDRLAKELALKANRLGDLIASEAEKRKGHVERIDNDVESAKKYIAAVTEMATITADGLKDTKEGLAKTDTRLESVEELADKNARELIDTAFLAKNINIALWGGPTEGIKPGTLTSMETRLTDAEKNIAVAREGETALAEAVAQVNQTLIQAIPVIQAVPGLNAELVATNTSLAAVSELANRTAQDLANVNTELVATNEDLQRTNMALWGEDVSVPINERDPDTLFGIRRRVAELESSGWLMTEDKKAILGHVPSMMDTMAQIENTVIEWKPVVGAVPGLNENLVAVIGMANRTAVDLANVNKELMATNENLQITNRALWGEDPSLPISERHPDTMFGMRRRLSALEGPVTRSVTVDSSYAGEVENGTALLPFKQVANALEGKSPNLALGSTVTFNLRSGEYERFELEAGVSNRSFVGEAVIEQFRVTVAGIKIPNNCRSLGFKDMMINSLEIGASTTMYFDNCGIREISFEGFTGFAHFRNCWIPAGFSIPGGTVFFESCSFAVTSSVTNHGTVISRASPRLNITGGTGNHVSLSVPTPPATGAYVLKAVNGEMAWVEE